MSELYNITIGCCSQLIVIYLLCWDVSVDKSSDTIKSSAENIFAFATPKLMDLVQVSSMHLSDECDPIVSSNKISDSCWSLFNKDYTDSTTIDRQLKLILLKKAKAKSAV